MGEMMPVCLLCWESGKDGAKNGGWGLFPCWMGSCGKLFLFNVQCSINFADMTTKDNKVSLREYALRHNPVLNRRGKPMSEGYLYRLIREDIKGINSRDLWFKYELTGEKDRIYIHLS